MQTAILIMVLASGNANQVANASEKECPEGYRLHYQGFCINKADEIADDPVNGVRTLPPKKAPKWDRASGFHALEKIGYKFSNMKDGEYCKDVFVRISRSTVTHPVAFALGEQCCGFSDSDVASLEAAEARAMAECEKHTRGCKIILPEEK